MVRKIFSFAIYIFASIGFLLTSIYLSVQFGLTNSSGIVDNQHDYFKKQMQNGAAAINVIKNPDWMKNDEWLVLKDAILKDKEILTKVSALTGIPERYIITPLVVEQLRLFHSERELFKQVFSPLKILAVQSQFSWGVMGIKQDTARQIEANLKSEKSPWYLGKNYENLLDFNSSDPNTERFNRLTAEHDRYYSYLYMAILMKELLSQWKKAEYPINDRPEIIATLVNIGFQNSKPNNDPQIGGAQIEINGKKYSFGGLAGEFYYSNELQDIFPSQIITATQ